MGSLIEVRVPDIGDFKDVEIIEVAVRPGDAVASRGGTEGQSAASVQ